VLDVGTGSARFDPNVESTHHHLVCRSCGKVRDLAADFPGLTVSARGAQGFVDDSAEVVFRGLCDECRGSQISQEPQPTK
jgi:Fe2+ or Zn2+ uptake regulation protein